MAKKCQYKLNSYSLMAFRIVHESKSCAELTHQ